MVKKAQRGIGVGSRKATNAQARSAARPKRGVKPGPARLPPGSPSSLSRWAFLNDEWKVDQRGFESPQKQRSITQTVVFSESMKDGAITAQITLVKSLGERWQGFDASEANVIFRYGAPDQHYENVKCTRADQLSVSRPIMEDVQNEIARADLVIVDLTGRNSNVYYEAGMAAAWKKDWIVISQSNEDLTFDVEQIRTIPYTNRMGGAIELEARLRDAIESTLGLSRNIIARGMRTGVSKPAV